MNYLLVGKIVNTFGLKGELKIVSSFEMKEKVYKVNNKLIINNKDYLITNVRIHKNNYLVELNNIKDINLIEYLKGYDVYFNEEDLNLLDNEYLISELINYEVYDNEELIGKVTNYELGINPLIKVNDKFYIPVNGNYIIKVDKTNKKVIGTNLKGLIL